MKETFLKKLPVYLLTAAIFAAVIGACVLLSFFGKPDAADASITSSPTAEVTVKSSVAAPVPTATTDTGIPDVEQLSKRVYELSYFFGINSFDAADNIPTSALAQYAFCHLFTDSLVDAASTDKLIYRQAVEASIQEEVRSQFLITSFDAKKSDLYNADKKIFEMWQPDYSRQVYYDAGYEQLDDTHYQLTVTFFTSADKTVAEKKYQAELVKKDGSYLFVSMQKI